MAFRWLRLAFCGAHNSIVFAVTLTTLAVMLGPARPAAAKTPGTVHCYGKLCHRIHDVDETDAMVGRRGTLKASYYDDCKRDRFNPCGLTSSGAIFRPDLPDNAASPIFPDGTILLTYNPETKLAAVVRVNSAGPYRADRTLDVSRATAEQLGFREKGVATLDVAVLKSPEDHEAKYKKLRTYDAVPGFLGKFETFEDAQDAALAELALQLPDMINAEPVVPNAAAADIERLWPRGLAMDAREARVDVLKSRAPGDALDGTPALTDAGPSTRIAASDAESTLSAAQPRLPDAEQELPSPTDLTDWLTEFVERARAKARLRRAPEVLPLLSNGVS